MYDDRLIKTSPADEFEGVIAKVATDSVPNVAIQCATDVPAHLSLGAI
jgi:hypothetical protein